MHLISVYIGLFIVVLCECRLSYDWRAIWLYNPVLSAHEAILPANHRISYL